MVPRRAALLLTALAASRVVWLLGAWISGAPDVARHHVESAAYIFAALLLVAAAFCSRSHAAGRTPLWGEVGLATFLALSSVLLFYRHALFVGLLSDDFVLLHAALEHRYRPEGWEFVRPLPMMAWSWIADLIPLNQVPAALHALNIGLHGFNTAAVFVLARRLGFPVLAGALASALFACFPIAVEPVAWGAGIFDVALTAIALQLILLTVKGEAPSLVQGAAACALTVAALATKETAVGLPAILAAGVYGCRKDAGWRAYWIPALSAVCTAVYIGFRFSLGVDADLFPPFSGYLAKELVSRPYGALAVPFHAGFIEANRWAAMAATTAVPLLILLSASTWCEEAGRGRQTLFLCAWVLFSVLPVFTAMYVGPDLQGSRYLYLGTAPWALVLSSTANTRTRRGLATSALLLLLICVFASASRSSIAIWARAAAIREVALARVIDAGRDCAALRVVNVPDSVDGAFVFRNGLQEALTMRGTSVRLDSDDPAACLVDLAAVPAPKPQAPSLR